MRAVYTFGMRRETCTCSKCIFLSNIFVRVTHFDSTYSDCVLARACIVYTFEHLASTTKRRGIFTCLLVSRCKTYYILAFVYCTIYWFGYYKGKCRKGRAPFSEWVRSLCVVLYTLLLIRILDSWKMCSIDSDFFDAFMRKENILNDFRLSNDLNILIESAPVV